MSTKLLGCALLLVGFVTQGSLAWAQVEAPTWAAEPKLTPPPVKAPADPPPAIRIPTRSPVRPPGLSAESTANLPSNVQHVIDFYGGATSARALSQMPQRPSSGTNSSGMYQAGASSMPAPPAARQARKPYEGTVRGAPRISPYLTLFNEENNESLPNYHMYTRPAIQQSRANASAQRQLNTLERQVRTASYGAAVPHAGGAVPGTGHGTRYFNTSRFYPNSSQRR